MPIHECTLPNGAKGYQWGNHGKCYPSREAAQRQAEAAHANGWTGDIAQDAAPPLFATGGKDIVLRPVHANRGIEAEYRRRLKRMIREMQDSIDYWLASAYKQALPELAQDATPISIINAAMSKMRDQWQKRFDDGAVKLAAWFAQKTKNYADDALKKILADAGFAVPFRMTEQMKIAYGAVISENVGLIRNISEQHLAQIEGMVMRSVQNNQDMGELYAQLKKRYAMTNRRAALIARDQNNKATAVIVKTQQLSIGITKAQWVHSTAGAHPRPSHVKASKDKLVYDIEKGAFIDGKYIWPGTEINCRCVAKSLIPALNPEIYKK